MTIEDSVVRNIVKKVIKSQDYRAEILNLINVEFLNFTIDFFKKVVDAKFNSKDITMQWYRQAFMNPNTKEKDDIAIFSGINMKTIENSYGTTKKNVVIDASNDNFDALQKYVEFLVENEKDVELTLTIKFKNVSVDLNISESLIVINALAVKRAAIRGGYWSTAGKRAEKYIMLTLLKMYDVPKSNYDDSHFVKDKKKAVDREIDFYLLKNDIKYNCEVKLMGKGNPESADAIFSRRSNLFVADRLSQQNKKQAEFLGTFWVCLNDKEGYKRFGLAMKKFGIDYKDYSGNLEEDLDKILDDVFPN